MPSLDDKSFQALQDVSTEVALRANRLHDLVKIGEIYRNVDSSYKALLNAVKSAEKDLNWGLFEDLWLDFKNVDFEILCDFARKSQFIRQRGSIEGGDDVGAVIDGWIKELENRCGHLQKVIEEQSKPQMKAAAIQVQQALMMQTAAYKNLINHEVERLCRLTDSLRDQLKID